MKTKLRNLKKLTFVLLFMFVSGSAISYAAPVRYVSKCGIVIYTDSEFYDSYEDMLEDLRIAGSRYCSEIDTDQPGESEITNNSTPNTTHPLVEESASEK